MKHIINETPQIAAKLRARGIKRVTSPNGNSGWDISNLASEIPAEAIISHVRGDAYSPGQLELDPDKL